MAYTKHTWAQRLGTGLSKFTDMITGTVFNFQSTPDSVTQVGTPFSAAWMNELEDGVSNATTLSGNTNPNTSTAGVVGQFYINTVTQGVYVCAAASGGAYTWVPAGGMYPEIAVTAETGAVVTATCGTMSISETSVNGVAKLSVPTYGTWTVTATFPGGGTSNTAEVAVDTVKQYTAAICNIGVSFALSSWANVVAVCNAGAVGSTSWAVGNSKTLNVDGTNRVCNIVGIGHDTGASGTLSLSIMLLPIYAAAAMGTSATVGWGNSPLRNTVAQIKSLLPADVQSGIKTAIKSTEAGGGSSVITTTSDDIWIPSETEIFGTGSEGTQYGFFENEENLIKSRDWWTRSPRMSGGFKSFAYVTDEGTVSYSQASTSRGYTFGFCI